MKRTPRLTRDRLRESLHYEPRTGLFTWLKVTTNRVKVGEVAGTVIKRGGYIEICIDDERFRAHRLAWFYVSGAWPVAEVDHRDGVPTNNKWLNLRAADRQTNAQNIRKVTARNHLGVLGVGRRPSGRYKATLRVDGRDKCLGTFDKPEQAHAAYVQAKRQHHAGCTI